MKFVLSPFSLIASTIPFFCNISPYLLLLKYRKRTKFGIGKSIIVCWDLGAFHSNYRKEKSQNYAGVKNAPRKWLTNLHKWIINGREKRSEKFTLQKHVNSSPNVRLREHIAFPKEGQLIQPM